MAKSEEQVQRPGHVIGECALVSGKCAQLTEDDKHSDTIQETGHDGIGDEAQDKAQSQKSCRYLEQPNENDQGTSKKCVCRAC